MKIPQVCESCPGASGVCEAAKEKIRKSKIKPPDVSHHPFTLLESYSLARKDLSSDGPFFRSTKPKKKKGPEARDEEIQTDHAQDKKPEQPKVKKPNAKDPQSATHDEEAQTVETGVPAKKEVCPHYAHS